MGSAGPGSIRLFRRCLPPGMGAIVMLGALLTCGLPSRSPSGSPLPAEPLSDALAARRVRAEDLRGREVYSFDEVRIGTLMTATDAALVALDPHLGRGCIAAPLGRLWLAPERRLLLDMTPHEFRTELAVQIACGSQPHRGCG